MENGELSPLKRFAECKGEIRRIFKNLQGVINETEDFLQTIEGFSRDESERMLLCMLCWCTPLAMAFDHLRTRFLNPNLILI